MPGYPWPWGYKDDDMSKVSALEHLNIYQEGEDQRKRETRRQRFLKKVINTVKKILLEEGNYKAKEANVCA